MTSSPFMTLPRSYYVDTYVYRAEIDRFFFNKWVCVGRTEKLPTPGAYFLVDIAGESIIVTRDESNQLRAHFNVCRHRGTRMCTAHRGVFPNNRIRCPYHAWTYDLNGALIAAPHMYIDRSEYPLRSVHVDIWEGHIFLNFSKEPGSLAEQLATLTQAFAPWRMAELKLYHRILYTVRANWKLIVSNYNECLHCPSLHPALNRLTDYMAADNAPASPNYVGGSMGFKPGFETMSTDGQRRRDYLPDLNDEQRKQVVYYAIFPNLLLSLHPDYMMTHTLWPRAVDRTDIICEFHFHPDELTKPEFISDDVVYFWDQTNKEDWRISELSQLGISSRAYTPGPYSNREELLWEFDQVVKSQE